MMVKTSFALNAVALIFGLSSWVVPQNFVAISKAESDALFGGTYCTYPVPFGCDQCYNRSECYGGGALYHCQSYTSFGCYECFVTSPSPCTGGILTFEDDDCQTPDGQPHPPDGCIDREKNSPQAIGCPGTCS